MLTHTLTVNTHSHKELTVTQKSPWRLTAPSLYLLSSLSPPHLSLPHDLCAVLQCRSCSSLCSVFSFPNLLILPISPHDLSVAQIISLVLSPFPRSPSVFSFFIPVSLLFPFELFTPNPNCRRISVREPLLSVNLTQKTPMLLARPMVTAIFAYVHGCA